MVPELAIPLRAELSEARGHRVDDLGGGHRSARRAVDANGDIVERPRVVALRFTKQLPVPLPVPPAKDRNLQSR